MVERLLIDASHPEEVRVAVVKDEILEESDFESEQKQQIKGNIYLGKITRVEPSLQAAFVDFGGNRHGFLPFAEVHYDYFQIPTADKERIAATIEQEEAEIQSRFADQEENSQNNDENFSDSDDVIDSIEAVPAEIMDDGISELPISEGLDQDEYFPEPSENLEVSATGTSDDTVSSADSEESTQTPADDVDDDMAEMRKHRYSYYRKYKIQEVLRRNQIVLVQVIKEERGNKGASLTTYISLAGRYCVLMPNTERSGGVSRRISDSSDRKRLKSIISELEVEKGTSVIVRTAGMDRSRPEIKRDYEYLSKLWENIRELTLSSSAPAMIHQESNLLKRALRDMYRNTTEEVVVEGHDAYQTTKKFMDLMAPSHVKKVKEHKEREPLLQYYDINDQLDKLYDSRVSLPSGGTIVLAPTEALVSIDVNSGKSTRERSIESTALKTNIEAAYEIARQLRLRDLAGLIVIDFIDMREMRNRRQVERVLKEALKSDRAKIQVGRISLFGLLEMSRQRLRSSLMEASTQACDHCNGLGYIRSSESQALSQLRSIEHFAAENQMELIAVATSHSAALYLLNNKRKELSDIEVKFETRILINADPTIAGGELEFPKVFGGGGAKNRRNNRNNDRKGRRNERPEREATPLATDNLDIPPMEIPESEAVDSAVSAESFDDAARRRNRGGRNRNNRNNRNRRNDRAGEFTPPSDDNYSQPFMPETQGENASAEEFRPHRSSTRRSRGDGSRPNNNRRPRYDNDQQNSENSMVRLDNMEPVNRPTRDRDEQSVSAPQSADEGATSSRLRGLWKKITN